MLAEREGEIKKGSVLENAVNIQTYTVRYAAFVLRNW